MTRTSEQRLQETLAQLPWLERSCLLLSINTDFTQEEIAHILNVTEEEVNIATLQGREQFRRAYYKEEAHEQISQQNIEVVELSLVASVAVAKSQEYTVRGGISNEPTPSRANEDISFSEEIGIDETHLPAEFRIDEPQIILEDQQSEVDLHTVLSDTLWRSLYPSLRSLVRYLVCTSPLPYWRGQEDDLVEDIVQETIRRVIERAQKAARGEASPILSLKQMAITVAYQYYRDLKRHDYRLSRLGMTDVGLHPAHYYPVEVPSDEYLLDVAAEKVDQESLFDMLASEIGHFPPNQKQAILMDLANRMYFDREPTSLQESFLHVGIELRHYRQPLPDDRSRRSRHISLVSQAYKRIASRGRKLSEE